MLGLEWNAFGRMPRHASGSVRACLALAWAAGSLAASPARAEAQITVDRLEIAFQARPDQPRLGVINVRNDGDRPLQALVKLEDWDRDEDGNNRWHPLGTVDGSCGRVLEVFPLSVNLDSGASQAIRVTLDSGVTLDRECWAAAVVETVAPRAADGMGVRYVIRTATKIYVQPDGLVSGGEVTAMDIGRMPVGQKGDTAHAVAVTFANQGRLHLVTRGEVQVRRADNTVAATIPLNPGYTLPGARVRMRAAMPQLPAGRYVVLAILDFGGAEYAAGQIEYLVP